MLWSRLDDYNGAYIIVKGIIAVENNAFQGADQNDGDKKVIFKNGIPFRKQISRINIAQADGAH